MKTKTVPGLEDVPIGIDGSATEKIYGAALYWNQKAEELRKPIARRLWLSFLLGFSGGFVFTEILQRLAH